MNPLNSNAANTPFEQWLDQAPKGKVRLVRNYLNRKIELWTQEEIAKHPDRESYKILSTGGILKIIHNTFNLPETTGDLRKKMIRKWEDMTGRRIEKFNSSFTNFFAPFIRIFSDIKKPDFGEAALQELREKDKELQKKEKLLTEQALFLQKTLSENAPELANFSIPSEAIQFVHVPIEKWTKKMMSRVLFELGRLDLSKNKMEEANEKLRQAEIFGSQTAAKLLYNLNTQKVLDNKAVYDALVSKIKDPKILDFFEVKPTWWEWTFETQKRAVLILKHLNQDPDSTFKLGQLFEIGQGVKQNNEKAFMLYKQALIFGYRDTHSALARIGPKINKERAEQEKVTQRATQVREAQKNNEKKKDTLSALLKEKGLNL